ncbi:MAG: hypothetical protein AABX33_01140 [Nanoarchaeota archaeon]
MKEKNNLINGIIKNWKILIPITLLILSIQFVSAEAICQFDFLIYRNDSVELTKINSYIGNQEIKKTNQSNYTLLFFDSKNNLIEEINLPVVFYTFNDPFLDVEYVPLPISQSCNPKWNKGEIFHNNRKIFSLQVDELLCNNDRLCNYYETYLTCPNDCITESNLKTTEKLKSSKEIKESKINLNWFFITLPLLLIFGLLAYIEINRRKNHKQLMQKHQEQNIIALRNYISINLKKGFTNEQIKNALIKNNYDVKILDEAFMKL